MSPCRAARVGFQCGRTTAISSATEGVAAVQFGRAGELSVKVDQILQLPSMPAASPSYPMGPYRFINREFMIVTYETDRDLLRHAVPEPLEPNPENHVLYEWIKMPDSSGFGDYTESGVVIPCLLDGEPINYTAQMYLDDEPPISAGREIWGFPKKYALPKLEICSDTLTGTLHYAGQLV